MEGRITKIKTNKPILRLLTTFLVKAKAIQIIQQTDTRNNTL